MGPQDYIKQKVQKDVRMRRPQKSSLIQVQTLSELPAHITKETMEKDQIFCLYPREQLLKIERTFLFCPCVILHSKQNEPVFFLVFNFFFVTHLYTCFSHLMSIYHLLVSFQCHMSLIVTYPSYQCYKSWKILQEPLEWSETWRKKQSL